MSQLNTPFTYWNANPFTDLKIINVLCTKKFDKIIISFENGIIWIFKIFNKTDGKKEFIPTLCLLGHETTVSALTLVKLNIELLNESDNAIVSTSKDGTIIMWDLNDGHCILKKKHFFNGIIKTIKVSKSMKYLICSGYSCDIYILTLDTLEIKQIININNDWISTMTLKNATSEIFLAYESGEMSIFKFDEESLNLINEETKTNIHTIPNAFEICINEYNPNIFFVLSKEICLIYSRQLNIELPILKVNSPDGLYWKKGQFLSPRTFILWTMNSNIYIYYIGHKSDLKIFNDNQISELDDSYEILLSNSEYHITIKKSILEHELLETNNPVTIIGTLNLGKSSVNAWDEADIQCIKGNNSEIHILSFQNIENKAFLYYWSFYSCINPINYITYYKKSENESNSNVNINSDSEKIDFSNETVIQIKPIHEILLEDLWNIKSENYPRKSLVTAVTSFSSLFIIFGYESGLIKVMPLYYPFLYDINTFSDSENEVYSLNGHSRRVTSLYVPKKIDSNGKLLLFSSSIDASVIIWDLESGKQLLKYNEYTRPVVQFVQVSKEKEGNLFHDCVVAFSEDNSISVFSLEKLECIYHLSGHYSELAQISWRKDSDYLCVQCVDKSVYVWHLKSMHLDRIITDPYYAEIIIGNCDAKIKFNPFNTDYSKLNNKQILSVFPVYFKPYGQIPVFVFYINIKQLINEINYFHRMSGASFSNSSSKKKNGRSSPENGINNKSIMNPNNKSSKQIGLSLMLKSSHFKGVGNPNGKSLSHLYRRFTQLLFSSLLTWEIDAELDNICKKKIGLNPNRKNITVGIKGVDNQFSLLAPFSSEDQIWKISPLYTASRLIKILSFVPIFLSEKGNEDDVISIITHYGIMLPGIVGPDYNYPSFSHLTKYWQDSTNDIQQAARCLYRSTLSKISESDLDKVLNYWEPYLVIDDPNNLTKVTLRAAILLGIIGADENDLLKSKHTLCNHISKALLLIIENKTSLQHRIAAVELIGKGFLVWEPYINGSAVIRILMNLANLNPNSPSSTNNSPTNSISSSKSSINTGNNINNNNNNTNNNNNKAVPSPAINVASLEDYSNLLEYKKKYLENLKTDISSLKVGIDNLNNNKYNDPSIYSKLEDLIQNINTETMEIKNCEKDIQ